MEEKMEEEDEDTMRLVEINRRWKDICLVKELKQVESLVPPCDLEERVCERCGTNKELRLCGGCHRVFYCSERCQHADWTEEKHMKHCYYMGSQSYHESVVLGELQNVTKENEHEKLRKMIRGEISLVCEKDKKLIPKIAISVITYWCLSTSIDEHTGRTFLHVAAERGFWEIGTLRNS